MSDNQGICESDNYSPLKGPFKGKGANRRALRELEVELDQIKTEMDIVVERFNLALKRPRPVHLRKLGKQRYPSLWWRMTGYRGTFIKLFDSDKGDVILEPLLEVTRQLLVEFDKERIHLNFRSCVVGNTLSAYRIRERDLAILERLDLAVSTD